MSPLPVRMRDRWASRAEPADGQGSVYWHVLVGVHPEACAAAADVRSALHDFPGLHLTPPEWLHMTLFVAGSTDDIDSEKLADAAVSVRGALRGFPPVDVSVSRVLYHPEAIMLAVEPVEALRELRERVRIASIMPIPELGISPSKDWIPHVTVAYSTTGQPAAPIIGGLGSTVPARQFTIDTLSLIVQWGPERSWNWEEVTQVPLYEHSTPRLSTPTEHD